MSDTLTSIRNALASLRNSEKKVARCVMQDPRSVVSLSITELAEKAGTSEPTVIRFCRKLGLTGYMELRLNLARDLPSAGHIYENVGESDSIAQIAGKILNSHREAISNTLNKVSLEVLESAVEALCAARRVEFYGLGGSAIVAMDAHHKFFRLGISCIAYDDPHMQVMSAALLAPGDVAVVVSHTGSTKDIIDSVKVAKKAGAKVIGILGTEKCPLSKFCDIPISVYSQEAALRLAPMTSRLAQMAIIDVLFVSVAMKEFKDTRNRLDKVKRALVDKRY